MFIQIFCYSILFLILISLSIGIPIFYSLSFFSIVGLYGFYALQSLDFLGSFVPAQSLIHSTIYDFLNNYHLGLIPLFIAVGNLAGRTGIIRDFYTFLAILLRKIPGSLAITTIFGCGGFSAVSGSSVVCAATLSRIAIPEMLKYGYKPSMAAASVAAGGTLGSLVPPSILFILYSYFAQQSVQKLFLAAIIPSLLTFLGYCVVVVFKFHFALSESEKKQLQKVQNNKLPPIQNLISFFTLALIISGIYFGFFTPTESAAVSLCVLIFIVFIKKQLKLKELWQSLKESVLQTAVIFSIAIGAKLLITFLTLTSFIENLLFFLDSVSPSAWVVLLFLILIYLVLGMFLDSIGILVLTLPFMIPIAETLGWNLIWFGVLVVKLLEIGLITPPVGLNVFVIHTAFPKIPSGDIFRQLGAFLVSDFFVIAFIVLFPTASIIFSFIF